MRIDDHIKLRPDFYSLAFLYSFKTEYILGGVYKLDTEPDSKLSLKNDTSHQIVPDQSFEVNAAKD